MLTSLLFWVSRPPVFLFFFSLFDLNLIFMFCVCTQNVLLDGRFSLLVFHGVMLVVFLFCFKYYSSYCVSSEVAMIIILVILAIYLIVCMCVIID